MSYEIDFFLRLTSLFIEGFFIFGNLNVLPSSDLVVFVLEE